MWRLDYRLHGKRGTLSLGKYPQMSLPAARKAAESAREALAAGRDPALEKRRTKAKAKTSAGDTFAAIAAEYIAKRKADGDRPQSPATAAKSDWLAAQLNPAIGPIPVASIEPGDILAALRKLERKGNLESARRALQFASQVFRYAVATVCRRPTSSLDACAPVLLSLKQDCAYPEVLRNRGRAEQKETPARGGG